MGERELCLKTRKMGVDTSNETTDSIGSSTEKLKTHDEEGS